MPLAKFTLTVEYLESVGFKLQESKTPKLTFETLTVSQLKGGRWVLTCPVVFDKKRGHDGQGAWNIRGLAAIVDLKRAFRKLGPKYKTPTLPNENTFATERPEIQQARKRLSEMQKKQKNRTKEQINQVRDFIEAQKQKGEAVVSR